MSVAFPDHGGPKSSETGAARQDGGGVFGTLAATAPVDRGIREVHEWQITPNNTPIALVMNGASPHLGNTIRSPLVPTRAARPSPPLRQLLPTSGAPSTGRTPGTSPPFISR